VKRLLLLLPVAALVAMSGSAPVVTQVVPASSTFGVTSTGTPMDLPVLRHQDAADVPVPSPATPAVPAAPAAPVLPNMTAVGPPVPVSDDPCDGISDINDRSECRDRQLQREERDREREFDRRNEERNNNND
jgi:hypothetical protein